MGNGMTYIKFLNGNFRMFMLTLSPNHDSISCFNENSNFVLFYAHVYKSYEEIEIQNIQNFSFYLILTLLIFSTTQKNSICCQFLHQVFIASFHPTSLI